MDAERLAAEARFLRALYPPLVTRCQRLRAAHEELATTRDPTGLTAHLLAWILRRELDRLNTIELWHETVMWRLYEVRGVTVDFTDWRLDHPLALRPPDAE